MIAASSVTSKAAPSAASPAARMSPTAASTRAGSVPLTISRAPAFPMPSAIARPSPREEPVTSAVRPVRSNSESVIQTSPVAAAHDEIRAIKDRWLQIDAQARPFHRIDIAILDHGHGRDKLVVPAIVEGAHRFLDQRVRLAEGHV